MRVLTCCRWMSLVCAAVVFGLLCTHSGWAQESSEDAKKESVKVQPYTGPPIFLDEAEQVAEPTVVRTETVNEKYKDGTVRIEREIAHFSDNHFEANGKYREFYPNGKLFVEGQYVRGRQN